MCSSYDYAAEDMAYIASDGNYGGGTIIVYNPADLLPYQLELMVDMHDDDRFDYIKAILDADLVLVDKLEAQYV